MHRFIIAAVIMIAAVSCYYGDPGATSSPGTPSNWSLIGFTHDGSDTLNVAGDMNRVKVTAPSSNVKSNTRIGWITETGDVEVSEVCVTWESHTGDIDQPGLIVHFDGTHAVTMTQNIWGLDRSMFNFHVWDLSQAADSGKRFTQVGSFRPSRVGAGDWPLRACLRAVGPFIDGKVWPIGTPDPAYGDATASGGVMVADQPGRSGWYAGHLHPGGEMVFNGLYETS